MVEALFFKHGKFILPGFYDPVMNNSLNVWFHFAILLFYAENYCASLHIFIKKIYAVSSYLNHEDHIVHQLKHINIYEL